MIEGTLRRGRPRCHDLEGGQLGAMELKGGGDKEDNMPV
jgi:hypothetical protein